MKIVVDVNLSPEWASALAGAGHEALHWSQIGPESAPDTDIIRWAAREGFAVFTADLDFGSAVARLNLDAPSVIQLRTESMDPLDVGAFVLECVASAAAQMTGGSILTIDKGRVRLRRRPDPSNVLDER